MHTHTPTHTCTNICLLHTHTHTHTHKTEEDEENEEEAGRCEGCASPSMQLLGRLYYTGEQEDNSWEICIYNHNQTHTHTHTHENHTQVPQSLFLPVTTDR